MKKNLLKKLSMFVILSLFAPVLIPFGGAPVVQAKGHTENHGQKATVVSTETGAVAQSDQQGELVASKHMKKVVKPSLNVRKITLKNAGDTYQIRVKNVVSGSAITWKSVNKRVATVSEGGIVMAVDKGTTSVKCIIVTPTKQRITLSCVVNVAKKAPVIAARITNEVLTKGYQIIEIGKSFDFDALITPLGQNGELAWIIADPTKASVDANGVVTGIAAGTTTLTVSPASITLPLGTKVKTDTIKIKIVAPTL